MNIIISELTTARKDTIYKGSPYIPKIPRQDYSAAFIIDGIMEYTFNKEKHIAKKNDIILIPMGYIDTTSSLTEKVSYYFFNFRTLEPLDFSGLLSYTNKTIGSSAFIQKFKLLLGECDGKLPYSRVKAIEIAYSIFSQLLYELTQSDEYFKNYNKIKKALLIIDTQFSDKDLTVSVIAEKCNMSISSLNRLFRTLLNTSPACYLRKKRMNNAQQLLLNGIGCISELAEKCGYSDLYSFSRAFKNTFGCSPSKYT